MNIYGIESATLSEVQSDIEDDLQLAGYTDSDLEVMCRKLDKCWGTLRRAGVDKLKDTKFMKHLYRDSWAIEGDEAPVEYVLAAIGEVAKDIEDMENRLAREKNYSFEALFENTKDLYFSNSRPVTYFEGDRPLSMEEFDLITKITMERMKHESVED